MPNTGYEVIVGDGRKGAGLFATRPFAPGAALFQFDYWSRPIMPMHSTNHSCDPNAAFDQDGALAVAKIHRLDTSFVKAGAAPSGKDQSLVAG